VATDITDSSSGSEPIIPGMSFDLDIRNILLVDDDTDLLDVLKTFLESHNYVVTAAKNGVEALHEVIDLDFDAIICDMKMPTMPGDMFYLAVQRIKPYLCDRFIFVTAHEKEPKIEAFIRNNKGAILLKPFHIDELIRTLAMVFRKKHKH